MRKKEREISDIAEIESVINAADVCRIAFADNGVPYIVTMNFGYTRGTTTRIYFHCAREGRKLEMIKKNNYVCFEMDTDHQLVKGEAPCDFSMKYRSVVGYGHISILDDESEKVTGLNSIMSHYSDSSSFTYNPGILAKTILLCLEITEISGKRC